jgi:hypothetical protein
MPKSPVVWSSSIFDRDIWCTQIKTAIRHSPVDLKFTPGNTLQNLNRDNFALLAKLSESKSCYIER